MKSPKTIISLLAIMLITTMVAFISSANKNEALQRDLDRMTQNVANVNYDILYDKVQDSLPVAQNNALQVKYDELQKLHLTDAQLIKDLKVRLKDAQTIHTVSSATTDTVPISPVPRDCRFRLLIQRPMATASHRHPCQTMPIYRLR